jgi:heptosyltransferase II
MAAREVEGVTAPIDKVEETLVFSPRGLTGAVRVLPVFHALASRRSLAVLAPGDLLPLLRLYPGVATTLQLRDSEDATVSLIRRNGYREGILLDESLDTAWLAFTGALGQRWGYRGFLRSLFLKPGVERPRGFRGTDPQRFQGLLRALDAEPTDAPERWIPRLTLPREALAMGPHFLERARVPDTSGPLVGLAPVSDLHRASTWPWERFAELARTLRRQNPSVRQILIANGERLWPVVRIHEETARFYPVLGPDLDLAALAGVLAQLDLLITVESGIMHLAAALGVPCLALFGHRDPAIHGPLGAGHTVMRDPPSALARWFGGSRILADLEVETVVERAERILF